MQFKMLNYLEFDYFSSLLQNDMYFESSLEMMVDDLQTDKKATVYRLICTQTPDTIIWNIFRLLATVPRLAGNAAYVIGTIAETDIGKVHVGRIINSRRAELKKILLSLTDMLAYADTECVLNAAGTLATLSIFAFNQQAWPRLLIKCKNAPASRIERFKALKQNCVLKFLRSCVELQADMPEGRDWILSDDSVDKTITNLTQLLNNKHKWIVSNATLVIARLSMSEDGCQKLVDHKSCESLIDALIDCLVEDETGREMNAAFSLGRIAEKEEGHEKLLHSQKLLQMLSSLINLLSSRNSSCCKNSCCALNLFMSDDTSRLTVLRDEHCHVMLSALCSLLQSSDEETQWFASVTLKSFIQQIQCNILVRSNSKLMKTLRHLKHNKNITGELQEEILNISKLLRPLSAPGTPTSKEVKCTNAVIKWERVEDKFKLPVSYKLYKDDDCVYQGEDTSYFLQSLSPKTEYRIQIKSVTEFEESKLSDTLTISTADIREDIEPPSDLVVVSQKSTQLKVSWQRPPNMRETLKNFAVYLDGELYQHTTDTVFVISGLSPSTLYQISVCSCTTSGDKSDLIAVSCYTTESVDHAPSKPEIMIRGRFELFVSWKPPVFPLGRVFRYELTANGNIVYSGTELHYTICRLKPDSEYIITVSVVTSEGKFESKMAKKKTAKDEFEKRRIELTETTPPERKLRGPVTNETGSPVYSGLEKIMTPRRHTDPLIYHKAVASRHGSLKPVNRAGVTETGRRNTEERVRKISQIKTEHLRKTLTMNQQEILLGSKEQELKRNICRSRNLHKIPDCNAALLEPVKSHRYWNVHEERRSSEKRVSVTSLSLPANDLMDEVRINSILNRYRRSKIPANTRNDSPESKRLAHPHRMNSYNTKDNSRPGCIFSRSSSQSNEQCENISKLKLSGQEKARNRIKDERSSSKNVNLPRILSNDLNIVSNRIPQTTKETNRKGIVWKKTTFLPGIQ